MRLFINGGDWNTVAYVSKLQRNVYTDWYFRGYEDHPSKDGSKVWNYSVPQERRQGGNRYHCIVCRSIMILIYVSYISIKDEGTV